jgi:hypothetical protein
MVKSTYTNLKHKLSSKKGMSQLAGTALAMAAGVGTVVAITQFWQKGQKGIVRDSMHWQKDYLSAEADAALGDTLKFQDTDFTKDYTTASTSTETDTYNGSDDGFARTSTDETIGFDEYGYAGPAE